MASGSTPHRKAPPRPSADNLMTICPGSNSARAAIRRGVVARQGAPTKRPRSHSDSRPPITIRSTPIRMKPTSGSQRMRRVRLPLAAPVVETRGAHAVVDRIAATFGRPEP